MFGPVAERVQRLAEDQETRIRAPPGPLGSHPAISRGTSPLSTSYQRQASGTLDSPSEGRAKAIEWRLYAFVQLVMTWHSRATGRHCSALPGCLRSYTVGSLRQGQ
jgi:hypothetical protein